MAAGFEIVSQTRGAIRQDRGDVIEGLLVVARRPVAGVAAVVVEDERDTIAGEARVLN